MEDHRHVTFCGRQPGHIESVDLDAPRSGCSRPATTRSRLVLPAPGRAYQGEDLPVLHRQVDLIERNSATTMDQVTAQPDTVHDLARYPTVKSSRARWLGVLW